MTEAEGLIQIGQATLLAFSLAAIISSVVIVRITQARATEWRDLATVRGEQVDEFRNQIADLRTEVAEMRGAITALEAVKAHAIAEFVVDLMGQSNLVIAKAP